MSELHPESIVTVAVLGGLVTLLARHVAAWRLDRGRSHLPWVSISASGIAFCVIRILHLSTADPERALDLVRCQYLVAIWLPGAAMATMESLSEIKHSRATFALLLLPLPLGVLYFTTSWFIAGPPVLHHDAFGHPFYGGHAGPGLLAIIPLVIWIAAVVARRARALPSNLARTRRSLRLAVVAFTAVGVHDTLLGMGVFRSIHVFELGYVLFSIVAANFEARRTLALRTELETVIEVKRHALADKQVELDAKQASLARAQAELGVSEARYRHLADATREGVALCDGTRIVDRNAALRHMVPTDDDDALALFAARDREAARALLSGEAAGPCELHGLTATGGELAVSVRATEPAPGSGGTRVLLLRDVSEERDLHQRLVRADRLAALGTLAAGTAHEINNPLTYVVASAEQLKDELTTVAARLPDDDLAPARALVDEVTAGATRIRRVVEQLMGLARDRPADVTAIDVRAVVELSLAMAASQLRHRAQVVRELAPVAPVHASEAQLGQVFLNLIVNAAQAIPEGLAGHHQVRVVTRQEGDRVVVEVHDTGVGMTAEVRDRIYDPFFTTKDVGQGTGLGLSISLGIVQGLGGSIDVTSAPGRGTSFRVTLPAMATAPLQAPVAPAPAAAPSAPRRVLIVDDEEMVARAIARMLGGHQLEIVSSGPQALARCAASQFDVVVCDLMMPEMTGIEVHRRLAAADARQAARMVFVTGGVSSEEAHAFLAEPGRRWVAKPLTRAELRRVIDDVRA